MQRASCGAPVTLPLDVLLVELADQPLGRSDKTSRPLVACALSLAVARPLAAFARPAGIPASSPATTSAAPSRCRITQSARRRPSQDAAAAPTGTAGPPTSRGSVLPRGPAPGRGGRGVGRRPARLP